MAKIREWTEGPWELIENRRDIIVIGPGVSLNFEDYESRRECKANAHLIKSAPDLYAALDGLMPFMREGFTGENREFALKRAEAALRKARGEPDV